MKTLSIILFLFSSYIVQSQIWEQVSRPFDYATVFNITSINDEIYISKSDWELGSYVNFKYSDNQWVRAEDDTISKIFGNPYIIEQFNNKILVSCREGTFLSIDSGESWTKIANPSGNSPQVTDIDISTNGMFSLSVSTGRTLLKFDENTNEWTKIENVKEGLTLPLYIQDIESNSTHLFGLQQKTVNPIKPADTLVGGLYISKDKGNSWEKTLIDSALFSIYATDNLLLVSTKYGNLLRSEDNGKTWTTENIGTVIINYFNDGNRILANSNPLGILESKDKGKTWQLLNKVIASSPIYKMENKYYFIGFLDLVYETDASFEIIKKINLINYNTILYSLNSFNDTIFSTGSFKRGVQYSTDAGENWATYLPELEDKGEYVNYIRKKDNQLYCSVPYALYSSLNSGETFDYNIIGGYSDLIILDDRILINSINGTSYSKDYGKTFTMTDTTVLKRNYKIFELVQTENKDILAFTQFDGVFKSSDNAETWTQLVDSLPTGKISAGIYDFYEFDGNYYAINISSPPLIIKSTDKGNTWGNLDIPLFKEIENFNLLMIDENNILLSSYNGDNNGLRITTNQGKTWTQIDNEFPTISGDLQTYKIVGLAGEYVFIQLRYNPIKRGDNLLYRASLEELGLTTSIESEIERNYLYTFPPYPLPAKSEVKVLFYWDINLPMTADDISVYDLSGRKIETKDNLRLEKQANHYGNLIWDCSSAQPGIYLININHGTEEKSVKVVVE